MAKGNAAASAGRGRTLAVGAGAAALVMGGCSADYRISVKPIPAATQTLQVATYLNDTIISPDKPFQIAGEVQDATYSFGLNQPPQMDGTVRISVGALDANDCLLAVGSVVETQLTSVSADNTQLLLNIPKPILTACATTAAPSIIDITRNIQGSLSYQTYSLTIQGWGFLPTATVDIRSTAVVRCNPTGMGTDTSLCAKRCEFTDKCPNFAGTGYQYCNCSVLFDPIVDVHHAGPATIIVTLHPEDNTLQTGIEQGAASRPPVGLSDLVSRPLVITVTNPNAAGIVKAEQDVVMNGTTAAALNVTSDTALVAR